MHYRNWSWSNQLQLDKNYQHLIIVRQRENTFNFKDFLRWNRNKEVDRTLEFIRKIVDFYHNKGSDFLKLGCILPSLANICLHKSTTATFFPFTERFIGKSTRRHGCWPIHCIYKESCCGRDFHSGFEKLLQVHCRKSCQSASSFHYVSINANWSVHKMEISFGIWQVLTASKQDKEFSKTWSYHTFNE